MDVVVNNGKTILLYCEVKKESGLTTLSKELLSCGHCLADKIGQTVTAILLGHGIKESAGDAFLFGADEVVLADDEALDSFQPAQHLRLLEQIYDQADPSIVMFGQTDRGRDLAPRLAFRKQTTAYLDCVSVQVDGEALWVEYTRPVYGGAIHAIYRTSSFPQIATIRRGVVEARAIAPDRSGDVREILVPRSAEPPKTRTVCREFAEENGVKLEDAETIVCGGRGIGGAQGFKQLQELAALLKGALGATRPPCDEGWVPELQQIGLTGKIVSPDLYIAVALSGASQHVTGCSKARTIVAINKDPDAYIFKIAHYGVVGDWQKVIPSFHQRVKQLLGE
jgi:electron transfer flavoprotein alpha subunit